MIPVARPDYSIFCVPAAEGSGSSQEDGDWTASNPSLNKDLFWWPNKSLERTRAGVAARPKGRER